MTTIQFYIISFQYDDCIDVYVYRFSRPFCTFSVLDFDGNQYTDQDAVLKAVWERVFQIRDLFGNDENDFVSDAVAVASEHVLFIPSLVKDETSRDADYRQFIMTNFYDC